MLKVKVTEECLYISISTSDLLYTSLTKKLNETIEANNQYPNSLIWLTFNFDDASYNEELTTYALKSNGRIVNIELSYNSEIDYLSLKSLLGINEISITHTATHTEDQIVPDEAHETYSISPYGFEYV
jgi:hypothetical protein